MVKELFFFILTLSGLQAILAQGGPPPPPGVPIDNGIIWLISVAFVLLGVYTFLKSKSKKV